MDGTLFPGDDDLAIPATEFFSTKAAKSQRLNAKQLLKLREMTMKKLSNND
uniref:14 kDa protein n=1 Tax=Cowpox virus TaxID=10243 RepID=Q6ELA6_COWPX|nr:14 kDa protein [Cowpox virus]